MLPQEIRVVASVSRDIASMVCSVSTDVLPVGHIAMVGENRQNDTEPGQLAEYALGMATGESANLIEVPIGMERIDPART
jgi:hypothetical protein